MPVIDSCWVLPSPQGCAPSRHLFCPLRGLHSLLKTSTVTCLRNGHCQPFGLLFSLLLSVTFLRLLWSLYIQPITTEQDGSSRHFLLFSSQPSLLPSLFHQTLSLTRPISLTDTVRITPLPSFPPAHTPLTMLTARFKPLLSLCPLQPRCQLSTSASLLRSPLCTVTPLPAAM